MQITSLTPSLPHRSSHSRNIKTYLCAFLLCMICTHAKALIYSKQDSTRVVELLQKGAKQPHGTNLMLFYANQLMNLPYTAATLEMDPREQLAINLSQMDCTTLIENVLAFALTTQSNSARFSDFCKWLQRIRYRNGILDGYASRNHYFTQWVNSNTQMGLVRELQSGSIPGSPSPFNVQQVIDLHFMTANPSKYPMLRSGNKTQKDLIRKYEQEASGKIVRYIPKTMLNKGKDVLGCIHDGDILALVTNKDGLDVTHLGLAVWGEDGLIHLLNASSLQHKVILDTKSLYDYMIGRKYLEGIRVIRAKTEE